MTTFSRPDSALLSGAVIDVSELVSLRAAHGSRLILLDASVPPVVPGYESLNSALADASWQIIPGARRFDYDTRVCDPDASLPHMMPTPERFEREARSLGINNDSIIVTYDDVGLYASPRAWWMFCAMGHRNVAVLDGGLRAWIAAGQDTESVGADWRAGKTANAESYAAGDYTARPMPAAFVDSTEVANALTANNTRVLDARSTARFNAEAPEPRPGVRGGHMPGAISFPFPRVLNGGTLKPRAELVDEFATVASATDRLVTSCGSGLTACVLTLGAAVAGYDSLSVYDGSWADWGSDLSLPVES